MKMSRSGVFFKIHRAPKKLFSINVFSGVHTKKLAFFINLAPGKKKPNCGRPTEILTPFAATGIPQLHFSVNWRTAKNLDKNFS